MEIKVKAVSAELIHSGIPGEGFRVQNPGTTSQVWRVIFDDGSVGEIEISPIDAASYGGKLSVDIQEFATYIRNCPDHPFPYSTNDLRASLYDFRKRFNVG